MDIERCGRSNPQAMKRDDPHVEPGQHQDEKTIMWPIGSSKPPSKKHRGLSIMICRYCGIDQPETKFKAYTYKGEQHRMKMCNSCRSKRDYPRKCHDEHIKKQLACWKTEELVRALELRGLKVIVSVTR